MQTASATVIDFEAYRARKEKRQREAAAGNFPTGLFAPSMPVAWMPVWFVPVYYPVGAMAASTASG